MLNVVSTAPLAVAATTTAALLIVLPGLLMRSGVLDLPGSRSSHAVATPRGAGLAVGVAALLGIGIADVTVLQPAIPLLTASAGALLLGLADDLRTLGAGTRLLCQVLLAAGTLTALVAQGRQLSVLMLVVALTWIVAFTNAFNFMDGINGISGGTVVVIGACWTVLAGLEHDAVVGTVGAVLAVACLVFLPWNVPRAAIFLGDSGSYFLGMSLAVLVVLGAVRGVPLEALVAPLAVYLTDTGMTLVRRALRGDSLLEAHREHVYHQLAAQLGHAPTALLVAAASGVTGGLGLLAARTHWDTAITGAIAAVCAAYAACPRLLRRPAA
jgi:UDP-GlcNAc:undecaprenyl-phosphate GlcNAc-1-phosphate transferase